MAATGVDSYFAITVADPMMSGVKKVCALTRTTSGSEKSRCPSTYIRSEAGRSSILGEWWNCGVENHVLVISSEASFDEQRPTRLDKPTELLARFLLADQMPGHDDHAVVVIVQAFRLDKVNRQIAVPECLVIATE